MFYDHDEFRKRELEELKQGAYKEGMEQGIKEGTKQGIEQGIEQGSKQNATETAKKLLKLGILTTEQIVTSTNHKRN